MAELILFGIAEEILKNLASRALDEIALAWGFKDHLEKLESTINTIKCVLLDAEERQADSRTIRDWLKRLATVVYDADDLFDEVVTIASRKQFMGGNKLSKKVRTFFSSSNQVAFAFSILKKIKTIREKLDDIFKDSAVFSFECRSHEEGSVIKIRNGRDQTYSYVDANEVIGRDGDKEAILKSLLACNEIENKALQVICIVGIGGQGKTTLAQYIYNDPQVDKYFELKLWVCVSELFNIKVITEKILNLTSNVEKGLEMEKLQGLLRNKLSDKRYLLVLDDVWNEKREEWLKLEALLKNGRKGSKILVTTRSKEVATTMGTAPPYELQGLQEEKSWELFQKLAFMPEQLQQKPHLMMKFGREVVEKCANVPLAIRSVASLLYGKDESKWMSFKSRSLANIFDGQNDTMDILKLSYQHLPSPLKNCFAYCALYPKDYEFDKEKLIDLWMAEGFIVPTSQEAQLEELAEDYFSVLLQRCFFQDVKEDEMGNIKSCKMHDLVHDLAQQMAGLRCKVAESEDSCSNGEIHHLSFAYLLTSQWKIPSWMLNLKSLRTFLLPKQMSDGSPFSKSICQELISSLRCLRVLDLHAVEVKSLPSSIGKLIHLRYLDLSQTHITKLPDLTIKLHNLQTLRLYNCRSFSTLPRKIRKLNKLRILDVDQCYSLNHMPSGLGELTSLTKLPRFLVNTFHSPFFKSKPNSAKLCDLKILDLRGDLHIKIKGELKNPLFEAAEANLYGKHRLTELHIELDYLLHGDDSGIDHDEGLLEGLKPHPNLKNLKIYYYRGRKLPSWAMNNLSINLPNLVKVELWGCGWCEQLPSFGRLPFLKHLSLKHLGSVEYMEMDDLAVFSNSSSMEPFFPSLENLSLKFMRKLKGWWKVGATVNDDTKEAASYQLNEERCLSMSFPKLPKLEIEGCPELISLPLCPNVEKLSLIDVNQSISVSKIAASSASTSTSGSGPKLKTLTVTNVGDLMSLPRECLHQLSELNVRDQNLVSTDKIEDEVFTSLSSSLRSLEFHNCYWLRYLSQGLEHLTAMEKLVISWSKNLDLSWNEQVPWKSFTSLRSLRLEWVSKLLSLPSGLQHSTNLHSLEISCNYELEELPEWIGCLSSLGYLKLHYCPKLTSLPDGFRKLTALNQLEISRCPKLTERCRAPNGADWPKIRHIPFLSVREETD